MTPSHYADVMIREGSVAHELHARLLLAAHQCASVGKPVAIAWPDWRAQPGEFGLLARVFGDESAVAAYLELVSPLSAAALVRIYPVAPVPATTATVRFTRDRAHDKVSPAAARRLTRRAAARGEAWKDPGKPRTGGDHYLTLPSLSQQQLFRLYIRRDTRPDGPAAGAGYGLGFVLPNF